MELKDWLAVRYQAGARPESAQSQEEPEPQPEPQAHVCTCQQGLSLEQAFEMFDVNEKASDTDVRAIYNRLMKRVHPDVGGSTFLAKQVNDARAILLNRGE